MPPVPRRIPAALGDGGEEDIDHAGIVALRRDRAEALVRAVGVAPRQLRAAADPEHREVAERRLADVREGGEGLRKGHGDLYNTPEMPARLLHPPYRRVPWKNGLGSTLEIATDATEPGAPWTWRLSFADVPARAPFSSFPGIDRHIAVLDGEGMTLERGAERIAVPREGAAFAFAGEDSIVGTPLGAGTATGADAGTPVRDANLMLDRRAWTGALEIVRTDAPRTIAIESELALIHLADCGESAGFRTRDESSPLPLHSTLVCRGTVTVTAGRSVLVIARLARRSPQP